MLRALFEKYVMGSHGEDEEAMDIEDGVSPPSTVQSTRPPPPSPVSNFHPRNSTRSLPTLPRSNARAESILRFTIGKMSGRNKRTPGGTTAQSLTDLICMEYGWPTDSVRERVERALQRAVSGGSAQVCRTNKEETEKRYIIAHGKMKECLEEFKKAPMKKRKLIKDMTENLSDTIKSQKKRKTTQPET